MTMHEAVYFFRVQPGPAHPGRRLHCQLRTDPPVLCLSLRRIEGSANGFDAVMNG